MKSKENSKQRTKQLRCSCHLLILPLILLAVLLAIGSAIWSDYRDQIMKNQKDQLLLTTRTIAENMGLFMAGYQDSLEFLSRLPEREEYQEIYERFLETQNRYECNIFWENAQKERIRYVRDQQLGAPVPVSQLQDGKSVWQYEDASGHKFLVWKKPLQSGNVLCLVVDEEKYYQQLISDIQIGSNGYVMVKNSSGLILMHPEKSQWGIHVIDGRKQMYPDLDFISLDAMVQEQYSGVEGLSEYYSYWWSNPDLPKVKKICAYAPADLGDDFWVVSAVLDYEDFYLPIEHGFRNVSLLYMGAILGFFLMFGFVGKLLIDRRQASAEIDTLQELNERLEEVYRGEEMLAHQQRLQVMGTMTGGIAHEFNNFLTPIMGYAELLMMELPEDSDEYDSALEIYEASEKAKDVIRQISSMSRRNVETVYKSIPVSKLLPRAVKMMDSICPSHIHLKTELDVLDAYVLGNATQINQVLLNICVNAFHAIGKKEGTVLVWAGGVTRKDLESVAALKHFHISDSWNQYLEIQVRDDGCGMEPDVLRQVFDPFFTTKKSGEGTGLGLALAEQIILSHKGYIYAESEVGKGSVFYVILPLMEAGTERALLLHNDREPLQMVIADDNAKVLQMLQKSFDKLHFPVATCRKREELLMLLEEEQPDALLIDESLEDGSGIEFCMALHGRYPGMLKIIMVDCFTKDIVEAKYNGIIDGYLAKPVSDAVILEMIRSCRQSGGTGV